LYFIFFFFVVSCHGYPSLFLMAEERHAVGTHF